MSAVAIYGHSHGHDVGRHGHDVGRHGHDVGRHGHDVGRHGRRSGVPPAGLGKGMGIGQVRLG